MYRYTGSAKGDRESVVVSRYQYQYSIPMLLPVGISTSGSFIARPATRVQGPTPELPGYLTRTGTLSPKCRHKRIPVRQKITTNSKSFLSSDAKCIGNWVPGTAIRKELLSVEICKALSLLRFNSNRNDSHNLVLFGWHWVNRVVSPSRVARI